MNLFSRVKRVFNLKKQEVFRRWSASEIKEKKVYLDNKPPEEFTAEDHYLAAEWVIQRIALYTTLRALINSRFE